MRLEDIERLRAHNYRRTPGRRVQTVEAARAFVEEMGFCHFWPIKDIEMPNLFHAIAGRVRSVPNENFGDLDDYLQEYEDGKLTAEAKAIYEAILEHGPLDTIRLRREARMSADSAKSRFDRALVELQVGLKVIPIGVAEAGAWNYAFVYEILQRHFPDLPAQARPIGRAEARRVLVQRYLDNVVAADRKMVAKVFHVLKWTPMELDRTIATLLEDGMLQQMRVKDGKQSPLVSNRALDQTS
jgi:hypothetical protein